NSISREAIKEFHCALIIRESLFFLPKFSRMRFPAAARESHGVLQVKHLVIKHVGDDIFRHAASVELLVDHDLLQRRVKAAELRAPCAVAPAQPRRGKRIMKVAPVEPRKERA